MEAMNNDEMLMTIQVEYYKTRQAIKTAIHRLEILDDILEMAELKKSMEERQKQEEEY